MKWKWLMLLIVSASAIILLSNTSKCNDANCKKSVSVGLTANSQKNIIELFTSEGCSSCPPAEKVIAQINESNSNNTIILCYHVDYWNYLGWKDQFSKNIFTERQKEYATQFNLESIYTPQAIVNGSTQFVGTAKAKLLQAIGSSSQEEFDIKITSQQLDGNKIDLTYTSNPLNANEKIVFALVQKMATVKVLAGENKGETLPHINIVNDIKKTAATQGSISLQSIDSLLSKNFFVVAFVQNTQTLHIKNGAIFSLQP